MENNHLTHMAENCFECKNKIKEHSEDQLRNCISKISDALESVQNKQVNLKEITEKEAMDQFVNTKVGEPSRMGSK
jgi:hypothetical protein